MKSNKQYGNNNFFQVKLAATNEVNMVSVFGVRNSKKGERSDE